MEQIWGPCVPLAGFSYTHLVIISCIRNGFSEGFFSFVTGAVRVLPPPHSALGWVSDVKVSCCSGTTCGSGDGCLHGPRTCWLA